MHHDNNEMMKAIIRTANHRMIISIRPITDVIYASTHRINCLNCWHEVERRNVIVRER